MPLINPSIPSDGDPVNASSVDVALAAIIALVNGNLDNDNIKSGSLSLGALASEAWSSWTPTLANVSGSSNVITAKYQQIGKYVYFRISLVLGTSGAFTAQPTFTLPVASVSYAGQNPPIGFGSVFKKDISDYPAACWWISTTVAEPVVSNSAGTYTTFTNVTGSAPVTFASGDGFSLEGFYEAA